MSTVRETGQVQESKDHIVGFKMDFDISTINKISTITDDFEKWIEKVVLKELNL